MFQVESKFTSLQFNCDQIAKKKRNQHRPGANVYPLITSLKND